MRADFSPLTAAVTGTGFIGPVHVEALRRIGVRVKGILGSGPARSQAAAANLGLETAYADYAALLADPEVQVVHVTAPNVAHFDMTRDALGAGKHVVCEKPLAMNSQETAALVALGARTPRLVAAVNYNVRFYPMVLHAAHLVRTGAIGEVRGVRGAYVQDWLLRETDWNWRLLPEAGGALRAVGDIGTHWMDTVGFITGLEVESLVADLATFLPRRLRPRRGAAETFGGLAGPGADAGREEVEVHTEDWGAVLFRYRGGARGAMNVSQVTAGRKNRLSFEITGSLASLAWDSERPNELWVGHRDRPNELLLKDPSLLGETARPFANFPGGHNEGFPDTFKQLYRAVYGRIRGDALSPVGFPTLADGHREVMLCEAILRSHQTQGWVNP